MPFQSALWLRRGKSKSTATPSCNSAGYLLLGLHPFAFNLWRCTDGGIKSWQRSAVQLTPQQASGYLQLRPHPFAFATSTCQFVRCTDARIYPPLPALHTRYTRTSAKPLPRPYPRATCSARSEDSTVRNPLTSNYATSPPKSGGTARGGEH